MRDIDTKVDGVDTLPADDFNSDQNELENVVTSADIILDPDGGPDTDLNMLSKAIAGYANAGNVYQDSGTADNYVLSIASNLKPVTKYYSNMMIAFKAGNSSTGASTVNVETLGAKSITLDDGTALGVNDIRTGKYVIAVYSLSNDRFEIAGGDLGAIEATSIRLGGAGVTADAILDEDDMVSDSATALSSQQAIKKYVDDTISNEAIFAHRENSNVAGDSVPATTWTKRTLNLTRVNNIVGASIASSVITLPAGTYRITGNAGVADTDNYNRSRFRNTSDNTTDALGSVADGAGTAVITPRSFIDDIFIIAATKNFELQSYTLDVGTAEGAINDGEDEIYSVIAIKKIA